MISVLVLIVMKIYLPHIHYTIHIKNIKYFREKHDLSALTQNIDRDTSIIWMNLPIKAIDHATLAHEIIHVLQYICNYRRIDFISESEHMGYLMQFVFNKATGFHYERLR